MAKKKKAKDAAKGAVDSNGKLRPKEYDKHLRKLQSELLKLQRDILTVNERLLMLTDAKK
jgi:polyphosphate kinase 2 (PPK2 family)